MWSQKTHQEKSRSTPYTLDSNDRTSSTTWSPWPKPAGSRRWYFWWPISFLSCPKLFHFHLPKYWPPKKSASESAPQLNSSRFSRGNASVSLFAEHCLNESKLPHCDTFNPRMKSKYRNSFSCILNNKHEAPTAGWHLVGGAGFTMNSLFCSQKLNHGGDSTGLGRWAFSRFQGRGNTSLCVYAAYCPVKFFRNPGTVWNQHCSFLVTPERTQIQIQGHCLLMTSVDPFQQD